MTNNQEEDSKKQLNQLITGVSAEGISKYRKLEKMSKIWEAVQETQHTEASANEIINQYKSDNKLFHTLMLTKIGVKQLWENIMMLDEAIKECQLSIDNIDTIEDEVAFIKLKNANQAKLINLMKTHAELLDKAESLTNSQPASLTQINIGNKTPALTKRDPHPNYLTKPNNNTIIDI